MKPNTTIRSNPAATGCQSLLQELPSSPPSSLVVTAPTKVSVKIQQSTGLEKKRAFRVRLGNDSNEQFVKPTGSSEKFTTVDAGSFQIPRRGTWRLWLEPARMDPGEPLFNVREVILSMP